MHKISSKLKILGLVPCFFLFTVSFLLAQNLRNIKGDITSFSVSGIEYSPKSKIISLINLNKGRALSDILVVNIIKELYALNLFEILCMELVFLIFWREGTFFFEASAGEVIA